jgi:hypothetical protein
MLEPKESEIRAGTEEIKVPQAKLLIDRRPSSTPSPVRKAPSRQPEIYTRRDSKLSEVAQVALTRCEVDKALHNGLDPISIELITSTAMSITPSRTEYYTDNKHEEIHVSPKISREMKNLQKSTVNSKILSDYLTTSQESPRRSRKNKEPPLPDPDELIVEEEPEIEPYKEIVEEEMVVDDEIELHEEIEYEDEEAELPPETKSESADEESDTTLILPKEISPKRRQSISRSRNRGRVPMRGRKKSIHRQMKEDVTSDKEELPGGSEEDDQSEVSYIANPLTEGRAVNPPPKVSFKLFIRQCLFLFRE